MIKKLVALIALFLILAIPIEAQEKTLFPVKATQTLSASSQINCAGGTIGGGSYVTVPIVSDGGAVDLTSNPQILTTGHTAGDVCNIKGTSDTNTVQIDDGTGVNQSSGSIIFGLDRVVQYVFDGTDWMKTFDSEATGGGSSTWLGLTDTPSSFTGTGTNYSRVNAAETALEFRTPAEVLTDIGAEPSSAYSGIGACAANQAATTLNDDAAPTCSEFSALGQSIEIGEVAFDPIEETELDTEAKLETQIGENVATEGSATSDSEFGYCKIDSNSDPLCNVHTDAVDKTSNQNIPATKEFDDARFKYGSNLDTLDDGCVAPSSYIRTFYYEHPSRGKTLYCCTGTGTAEPCNAGNVQAVAHRLQDATATDDDVFVQTPPFPWTVTFVYAKYSGCTITTAPTITVSDSAGNAMTLGATLTAIAHDASVNCSTDTGCVAVTAGGSLNASEGLEISISNAIDPSGECEVDFTARGTMD